MFEFNKCKIVDVLSDEIKFVGQRINDVYIIALNSSKIVNMCLMANKNTVT